jgi:hypothetical protein
MGWLARNNKVTVTAPNGHRLTINPALVRSVRAAEPGEYAPGVAAVIAMGHVQQGVKESPAVVLAEIGPIHHHGA